MKATILVLSAALVVCGALAGCAGKGPARQMTSEDFFIKAQELMAKKKYIQAKENLEEARRRFRSGDTDAKLLALLGDVHYRLEEYAEAIGVYEEFLKLHPRNHLAARVQYQVGMAHFKMIRTKDRTPEPALRALEAFQRVMENFPKSPEAKEAAVKAAAARRALAEAELFVARFYFRRGNWPGAIGRCEKVVREYADTGLEEEALYYLGESCLRQGDAERAQECFRQLLDRYPAGKYAGEIKSQLAKGK